jgi:hypothetical protein
MDHLAAAEPTGTRQRGGHRPESRDGAAVDAEEQPIPAAADHSLSDAFAALDAVRARLEHLSAENERLSRELEEQLTESVIASRTSTTRQRRAVLED